MAGSKARKERRAGLQHAGGWKYGTSEKYKEMSASIKARVPKEKVERRKYKPKYAIVNTKTHHMIIIPKETGNSATVQAPGTKKVIQATTKYGAKTKRALGALAGHRAAGGGKIK